MAWATVRIDAGKTSTGTQRPPRAASTTPTNPMAPPAAFSSRLSPISSPNATNAIEPAHSTPISANHVPRPSSTWLMNRPTRATTTSPGSVRSAPTRTSTAKIRVCGTGVMRSCRNQPDARSNEIRMVAPSAAPSPP